MPTTVVLWSAEVEVDVMHKWAGQPENENYINQWRLLYTSQVESSSPLLLFFRVSFKNCQGLAHAVVSSNLRGLLCDQLDDAVLRCPHAADFG